MAYNEIWDAIEQFASERRLSCSGLARCGGLDPTTFNRSKRWTRYGQERWPSMQRIAKILSAIGANIDGFTKHLPHKDNRGM